MALIVIHSSPSWKASADAANDVTRACHVIASGPNLIPGTLRRSLMARSAVVDFETIAGGATNKTYRFGYHWKAYCSIQTFRRRAPATATAPLKKCIRRGASVKEA